MDNNNKWDELSLTEKSEVMRQAVANGITDLNEIRQTYNEYAEGGSMDNTVEEYADAIYQNASEEPYGDPSPHYNNVNEELLRTLKPDYRGHYSDDVKLPNHPSSPTRGRFNGRYFDLTDKGMDNPNYTLFGLIDNGDGNTIMRYNGADVLPEVTVTPQGNYYDDTYNNIRIRQNNTFKGGGYIPSASIKRDIADFEGSSMKTNRSFEAEAKDFNRVIPQAIRNKLSQRQLDALYSYGYNVGMGNLKDRVLPTLTAYTQGRAGADDVAASMWASKDMYMRGLQRRRTYERNMFTGNSPVGTQGSIVDRAINMDLSSLPTVAQFTGDTPKFQYDLFPPNPTNYGTPIDWSTPEKKVETPVITPKEDNNGLGLLALINQIYDSPKQEPLATYTPQRNNSMFVVGAPTSNDTFLDSSWFKEGGYLYDEGGKAPTIFKTSEGYTTASGHPVEQIGWDDNGYARFRDTVTGDLGHAFEPSEAYTKTLVDVANLPKKEKELEIVSPEFDAIGLGGLTKDIAKKAASRVFKKTYKAPVFLTIPESHSLNYIYPSEVNSMSAINWDEALNFSMLDDNVKRGLSKAMAYKNSPEYKQLIQKARAESQDLGFDDFPEEAFTYREGIPDIVKETRDANTPAGYNIRTNTIKYDPNQIENVDDFLESIYHEGLHWQKVGEPTMYIGPKYQRWIKTPKSNPNYEIYKKDFINSQEINELLKRRKADKYIQYKVNDALYPNSDEYLRKFGELQVNGLEAGDALGIKPFSKYPGFTKALRAIEEARRYNPFLNDIKAGGEENAKRFWDILTGQYTPALAPVGIGGTLISTYNHKQ